MKRNTEVISFSLPLPNAKILKQSIKDYGGTLSEFLRDAIQQKITSLNWQKLRRLGSASAKKYKVSPEDIESIIDDFRD